MRALLLLACLLLVAAPVQAQRARLRVTVTSAVDGQPLPGVKVSLPRAGLGAVTDARGEAEVTGISPGQQFVTVERIGFGTEAVLVEFTPGATVEAEFPLRPAPIELEEVEVVAARPSPRLERAGFYDRQKAGFGTFLTEEWIRERRRATFRTTSLLRGIRGLSFQVLPEGDVVIVSSRGEGSIELGSEGGCLVQVFIDGVRVIGGRTRVGPQVVADLDDIVSARDIAAVEVYQGGATAPPQYAHPCGTILIWTYAGR